MLHTSGKIFEKLVHPQLSKLMSPTQLVFQNIVVQKKREVPLQKINK